MSFEAAYEQTKQFEGGYVNDPDDAGGETFRGISRRSHPSWPGWTEIDQIKRIAPKGIDAYFQNNKNMNQRVADFYKTEYWDKFSNLPDRLHQKIFDTSVNTGYKRAVIILQEALNSLDAKISEDGIIGRMTRASIEPFTNGAYSLDVLLDKYCERQAAFYQGLATKKASQKKFLKGWLKRAAWLPN
jgi:lysozyme family protein